YSPYDPLDKPNEVSIPGRVRYRICAVWVKYQRKKSSTNWRYCLRECGKIYIKQAVIISYMPVLRLKISEGNFSVWSIF
ncbi:MAG: hypothetical protein KAV00_10395, partial [Phycisphaerae bacterium]|nr:hypothetical protein [Phycisphaerae bacterium]